MSAAGREPLRETAAPPAGPVTRKIDLTKQLEEMRLLANEQQTELRARGRRDRIPGGIVEERLGRQAAIIRTLEFCRDHEAEFRAWAAARATSHHPSQTEGETP